MRYGAPRNLGQTPSADARTAAATPGYIHPTPDPVVAKLQTLVRIPTVSDRNPTRIDTVAFDLFLETLVEFFPLLHEHLELTRIHTHALLFHWRGLAADRPVVLMAHLDVVPVDESAPWQHDAFGAQIIDDPAEGPQIWGRGTLDDKGCLVGICESVERLLARGFTPSQDLWLSFGCDEEVSGEAASLAVAELDKRDVRPWFVLDEGGAIAHEAFPGVDTPVAVIGVTEKARPRSSCRSRAAGGTRRHRPRTARRPGSRAPSCASRRPRSPRRSRPPRSGW